MKKEKEKTGIKHGKYFKDQNRRNLLTWQSHKVIGKGDVEQKTKQ